MKRNKSSITKLLIFALFIFGLVFIIYSAKNNIVELKNYKWEISLIHLNLAGFFVIIMLYIKSLVHYLLLDEEIIKRFDRNKIIYSYSVSQIVRYIPGKVLGIATQSLHLTGKVATETIWNANLMQYV